MSETNSLNDQIRDALAQVDATLRGSQQGVVMAAAYQTIAHTIALGLQNAVAHQQQAYILRNALTTAAANAILDGKQPEAESILRLVESKAVSPSLSAEVADLLTALRSISDELAKMSPSSPPDQPAPEPAAADPTPPPPTGV
jgi:hypothetical protein